MKKIVKVADAILEKNGKIIITQRKSSDHLVGLGEFQDGKIEPGDPTVCFMAIHGDGTVYPGRTKEYQIN